MAAVATATAPAALALMRARRQTAPRRLLEPGPGPAEQKLLFDAAANAPDHGRLRPWRLVVVPRHRRADLGAAFAEALRERQPDAPEDELRRARDRADRAPFLCIAVLRGEPPADRDSPGPAADTDAAPDGERDVPEDERLLALGCAIQNLMLCATGLGYATGLVSGRALRSDAVARLLRLAPGERALCCVAVGRAAEAARPPARPNPDDVASTLP